MPRSSPPAADGPRRRQIKRPRAFLNCAECRRLKVRCDRQVPCANCVRRECADICPRQTLGSLKSMRRRVSLLEQAQQSPSSTAHRDRDRDRDGTRASEATTAASGEPRQAPDAAARAAAQPDLLECADNTGEAAGVGTLVVDSDGRSKFIGHAASFQWLRDETKENPETRPASPTRLPHSEGFPFQTHAPVDFTTLWPNLPPKDEAMYLLGCFQRHIAWNGSPILEDDLSAVLRWLYSLDGIAPDHPCMALQLLALLYIVLALGSLLNMEAAADDPACMAYYKLSQQCLVSGKFLVNNTLTTVQTLSLMAKFTAYVGMRDVAWQIRGIATRIMLAMGLHRDGQSWDLSTKDLNNRRRTFWEAYSTDVLISSNWDRPSGLHADLFDTQLPQDYNQGTGYEKQRCRMSMLAQEALQESLKIRSNYEKLREIWHKLHDVEADVPFHLRNRAALRFMVSKYPTVPEVEANTPPPSKNLRLVFQSHDLVDIASTLILSMFRPYFVHATQARNPSTSVYAEAYLAVIERSSMLIANLISLHSIFPLISTRHWFFWNHAFSGAVTMATICIANPGSPLVDQALNGLNSIISLYMTIQSAVPPKWVKRNLQWLLELRARANEKIGAFRSGNATEAISPASASEETAEHLLLVGWRRRLVELGRRDSEFIHRDSVPGPDEHDAIGSIGLDLETSNSDILSQLLGLTAEGPQFIAPYETTTFDFDLGLQ